MRAGGPYLTATRVYLSSTAELLLFCFLQEKSDRVQSHNDYVAFHSGIASILLPTKEK